MVAAVFGVVLAAQLVLVAVAGTDIPFYDQWDIEGRWLYPVWCEGNLRALDLFQPFNEHRILWTNLLNLGLFAANGQWDPLVQLVAIAVLRAACAAGIAWQFSAGFAGRWRGAIVALVATAFLPHLAWHNVLWGIESHAYFVLGFSLVALACLGEPDELSAGRTLAGLVAGLAAFLAMGPGALVPIVLLGMAALRMAERRRIDRAIARHLAVAAVLLVAALFLRTAGGETAAMRPSSGMEFVVAAGRTLGWPHVASPPAALAMNAPLLWIVIARGRCRRRAAPGEDFVILAGGWSVAVALATAWMRGGGAELSVGVPSRYVDFLVPLPLANAWCALVLTREAGANWGRRARWMTGAWAAFLLVGWVGLSTEVMRRLILPRARDREAPVRLTRAFQETGDVAVFVGQPRLLVPYPDPGKSVRAVLADPRLRGMLPPSLQPERPMGPLSQAVRWVLGR
jgi:hypothetical protein